jgi:hypothetical protein
MEFGLAMGRHFFITLEKHAQKEYQPGVPRADQRMVMY